MPFIDIEESRVLPSVGDEAPVAHEEAREAAAVEIWRASRGAE
jgi:hypothetical protein